MTEQTIILPPNPAGNGNVANYRVTVLAPKRRFFSYLRDRWWVVLVCIMLTVTPVLVYDTVYPEKYRSFAQLYLSGDIQITAANLFAEDRNYIGTQIELLKSPRLQTAAAVKASQGAAGTPPLVDVEVTQPLNTSILQLRATGADPAYTQRYLQALIDEYKSYQQETRQSTSDEVLYSFKQELAKREATLREVQTNYIEFQRTNSLAVIEEEEKSTALSLANLNQRFQELKLRRDFLSSGINPPAPSLMETNKSPRPTNQVASLTPGQDAGTNNNPGSGDAELKGARVRLSLALGDLAASPNTDIDAILNRHLKQRIDTARHEIATLEDLDRAQKQMDLQECEKQMSIITNTIPSVQAHMLEINERLSESLRFKNDIQREQGYYDHLLSMMQNVDLSKNVQQERASIVQAPIPARPVSRMLPLLIAIAAVAGVGLGSGIVFVWHLWDDRFSSVRDVKDQFGEMVLGLVPEIKVPRARPQEALLKDADPRYAYVESFRHLRSALLLSPNCERRQQTLLITGVSPGEGKTTVAFNLARTLARSGLRVVLVDADVGGAGLHRLLDQAEGPGMFDCLRREVSVQDVIHPTAIPGLSYVPRGLSREDRDGYFLRPEFGEFMSALRQNRDFVILDGPPVLSADDAALLVPHADTVLVVIRPFFTHSRLLRQALEMLYQRQAKDIAMIFNRARSDDMTGKYSLSGSKKVRRNGALALKGGKSRGKDDPTLPPPSPPTLTQTS